MGTSSWMPNGKSCLPWGDTDSITKPGATNDDKTNFYREFTELQSKCVLIRVNDMSFFRERFNSSGLVGEICWTGDNKLGISLYGQGCCARNIICCIFRLVENHYNNSNNKFVLKGHWLRLKDKTLSFRLLGRLPIACLLIALFTRSSFFDTSQ